MRLFRTLLPVVLFTSAVFAQDQTTPLPKNWYPEAVEAFGQAASSHTQFSFDRQMLVMAARQDQADESLQRVIAGIDGISIQRFKFEGPGMFDPRILADVRHEYSMAGWQHVGNAHDKYGYPQGSDVWLHLDHNTIRNVAVLFSSANQVNFVSVSGSISPIDLLHLSGHLGIPKIQGGVIVAGPGHVPPPTRVDPGAQDEPPPQGN